jgi:UDP-N-acetyl-D-galactosamine dehydrogenase
VDVYGYDPLLPDEVIERFGAKPLPRLDMKVDAVIIAVAHSPFRKMPVEKIRELMNDHPVLIDVRGMVDGKTTKAQGFYYRKL